MDEADKSQFAAIMTAASEYYRQDVSRALLQIYWQDLKHLSIEQFTAAMRACRHDARLEFFPKTPQILAKVGIDASTASQRAWAKVKTAVESIGHVRNVVFDDPVIHAALRDIGGYGRLCRENSDTMPFRQREFEQAYQAYAGSAVRMDYPAVMYGSAELDDRDTVLIGDERSASRVLEHGSRAPGGAAAHKILTAVTAALTSR